MFNHLFIYFYLVLIFICLIGLYINQSNMILVLIIMEIMFLFALTIMTIFCSSLDAILGQIASIFLLANIAVKSAIGLSILIKFYKIRGSISMRFNSSMKG